MTITFPLSLLLIPYGLVVVYVLVFSLINLQHLAHYGTSQGTVKTAVYVWFLGTIALIVMTFGLLRGVDWEHRISLAPPAYQADGQIDYGL